MYSDEMFTNALANARRIIDLTKKLQAEYSVNGLVIETSLLLHIFRKSLEEEFDIDMTNKLEKLKKDDRWEQLRRGIVLGSALASPFLLLLIILRGI